MRLRPLRARGAAITTHKYRYPRSEANTACGYLENTALFIYGFINEHHTSIMKISRVKTEHNICTYIVIHPASTLHPPTPRPNFR
jgi:hypothetical protein